MNSKTNFLIKTFFFCAIALGVFCPSAEPIELNGQHFCSLTIQDKEQRYLILVPRPYLDSIQDQLNVVGINCRNQTIARQIDPTPSDEF